jgi:WD40 repeat protein
MPIQSISYQGHQGPVLCLDYNNTDDPLLLSGSEDQTARLWDVREHRRRACLCIPTPGEVLSVAFGPKQQRRDDETMPVDWNNNAFAKDHTMYVRVPVP